jgi:hypothetical protein
MKLTLPAIATERTRSGYQNAHEGSDQQTCFALV